VNIPRQSEQGFHGKKNTNSTAKLMPACGAISGIWSIIGVSPISLNAAISGLKFFLFIRNAVKVKHAENLDLNTNFIVLLVTSFAERTTDERASGAILTTGQSPQ
jgi:hypothetical protein